MIGILGLNFGNIQSVSSAVYSLGFDPILINNSSKLDDISHLIIPGVGNFRAAMSNICDLNFMYFLKKYADSGRPLLGICLGMQILASKGNEGGKTEGLDLISGEIKILPSKKLPHVGWNEVFFSRKHPVLHNIKNGMDFYFVHSYHFSCQDKANVLGVTHYDNEDFPSIIGVKNLVGVQFHPEKSQLNGMILMENFLNWDGVC